MSIINTNVCAELFDIEGKHDKSEMTAIFVLAKQEPQPSSVRDRRGRDRMVVEFTTTCAISAYHH